jgi:hypothetical protein
LFLLKITFRTHFESSGQKAAWHAYCKQFLIFSLFSPYQRLEKSFEIKEQKRLPTSQMNLCGFSQFCCDKLLVSVFTKMQFDFELAFGSKEVFVVVLVAHQVTSSQDVFFPLVQKTSGQHCGFKN